MRPRVTIFDYGAGNLHSLGKALAASGAAVLVESDPVRAVRDTDALVLPGVGSFGAAAARLAAGRDEMRSTLQAGLPCLGICLGMQLLLDASEEGRGRGLGLVPGRVTRVRARRVPHIGWNSLEAAGDRLFRAAPVSTAYYANGYACRPQDPAHVLAWTTHDDDRFPAAMRAGETVGVQFHPEKSSADGLRFLAAFVEEVSR